jgi:alkaline phosphatase D
VNVSRRALVAAGLGAALLPLTRSRAADFAFKSSPFTLGIASGYPEPNAVVLWTRRAPEPLAERGGMPAARVAVHWEIAADDAFRRVVRRGTANAAPEWAHSVHVEAGGLEPARDYWYRFTSGGECSAVGHTRTAPARNATVPRLALAVASCQYYEFGHYGAYRAIARDDLDLVVHVGDYIYEQRGVARVRTHDLPECHTLDDYRRRYALYKSDAHLKAAHAACAWLATSDDHDVANDYAGDRAPGGESREQFLARRAAAYRAYYEHLPLPRRLAPRGPNARLYTKMRFGELAEIFMLDGRQYRSLQACGGAGIVAPCAEIDDPARTMLGSGQEAWLSNALRASASRWKLLGQQTLFAHLDSGDERERRYGTDTWNGYSAARARLVRFLEERAIANPVVLSGDIHAFFVNDVNRRADDASSPIVATELVTTSVSSPARPQRDFDLWRSKSPNVRLARSDFRGYLRVDATRERLHADLVAVDDVARAESGTHVLASFDVEDGRPGVAR